MTSATEEREVTRGAASVLESQLILSRPGVLIAAPWTPG
jgi:hypothetical protein